MKIIPLNDVPIKLRKSLSMTPDNIRKRAKWHLEHHIPTTEERFWSKVKNGSESECWPWTAAFQTRYKYGVFNYRGKIVRAHRLSFFFTHGEIPEGMFVCHRCDNPCCVNPSHLFLGTHQENMNDQASKGRRPIGESDAKAKLTAKQVLEIRASKEPKLILARRYGVSDALIYKIVKRQVWSHL